MASSYTSSLGLEKQADGENANTWGLRLNQSVIDLVDEAVAGYAAVALTSGTQTDLTVSNGSSSTARHASLEFTGNIAATVTVTVPAQQKTYSVINSVTNGGNILIKNTGAAANTGQTISSGEAALITTNGSLIKKIGGEFASGTKMIFQQTAAPLGWTKDTSNNDKALRITSGTVGTGGSVAFETAFASQTPAGSLSISTPTVSGTVGGTALTEAQLPSHRHFMFTPNIKSNASDPDADEDNQVPFARGTGGDPGSDFKYAMGADSAAATIGRSATTGSGSTHTHSWSGTVGSISGTFTGTAIDLDVQYVDVIICTKD
jgi:hypothetical protein